MYGRVPPNEATEAGCFVSSERLKSSSIGWPESVSRMFAGFRSRCRMPRPWACARPSASLAPIQRIASTYESLPSMVKVSDDSHGARGASSSAVIASAEGGSATVGPGDERAFDGSRDDGSPRCDSIVLSRPWPEVGMDGWSSISSKMSFRVVEPK